MATIAGRRPDVDHPRSPAGRPLWIQVIGGARCAESVLDPDDWFPVSPRPEIARREADAAIAICMACPVRAQCLELSLRHWDVGQHGVTVPLPSGWKSSKMESQYGRAWDASTAPADVILA